MVKQQIVRIDWDKDNAADAADKFSAALRKMGFKVDYEADMPLGEARYTITPPKSK